MLKRIMTGALAASAGVAVVGTAASPASAGSAGSASSAAGRCVSASALNNASHISTVRSKTFRKNGKKVKLELRRGKLHGKWYGWARLSGDTVPRSIPGLLVSFDGGDSSAIRCARHRVQSYGGMAWTGGYPESSSSRVKFRGIATYKIANSDWRVGKTGWW